jgi:hypothetical protein
LPEFFAKDYRYQLLAQPYLAAIAIGVRDQRASREFLLERTEFAQIYEFAEPLWQLQWQARGNTKCPFWSNYWFNPCESCNCRIDNSVSMEIDALFFLENSLGKRLAIHVEMKRDGEALSLGQAEAYRPRAQCYRDQRRDRRGILRHDHFMSVLFCGATTSVSTVKPYFDRVISHEEARNAFPGYPG